MPIPDRDLAINYLRYWYNASDVSSLVSANYITYPDFIKQIDTGSFLSNIGSSMSTVRQDKVKAAFEKLAKDQPFTIPSHADFFNYLAAEVGNFSIGDAASAAGGALADAGKVGLGIGAGLLGGYALWLALGAALIVLPMLGRAKSAAKEVF